MSVRPASVRSIRAIRGRRFRSHGERPACDATRFAAGRHDDLPFLCWACGRHDGYATWQEHIDMVSDVALLK